MSNHSNQAVKKGPSAPGEKKIEGSNPTYRAAIQKESRNDSSSKKAGSGKVEKIEGQGSAPREGAETGKGNVEGSGDGHYKPNKG